MIFQKPERIFTKEELLWDEKSLDPFNVGQSIRALRATKPQLKVGCYIGKFDQLLPADCVFLQLCRSRCDILVCVVPSDYSLKLNRSKSISPDWEASFNSSERVFRLGSLSSVNYIVLFDEEIPDLCLASVDPDFIFHGRIRNEKKLLDNLFLKDKLVLISYPWAEERMNSKYFSL